MCEQILKTAHQYNSNSLNCKKNQEKTNNSPSYCCAAIKNMLKLKKIKCYLLEERCQPNINNSYELNQLIKFPYQLTKPVNEETKRQNKNTTNFCKNSLILFKN